MPLLVVAYPQLKIKDYEWIQKIRSKHDELQYHIVEPHFTIVFPVKGLANDAFVSHIEEQIKGLRSFDFCIRSALSTDEKFMGLYHTFLVPDEGAREVTLLHDRLYTGILASELRTDIPFIPHIGIGNSKDQAKCKALAESINKEKIEIRGQILSLDIVVYEKDIVTTIERLHLSSTN